MKIDQFTMKLNKKQDGSVYVVEEELSGNYDGPLAHDNINNDTIQIFTGSKMSGEKVENFIISVPSETPWNRLIRIFSDESMVFVTYETIGDQVEADDINTLQDSVVATQVEVDRYKKANDLVVNNTVNRVTTLENNKAEKTYVDIELLKKADKVNTYTKIETDDRIQAVVGAAPDALDTLKEIGDALNNDPNFAATVTNELSKKVDKVAGKQLSTEDYTTAEKTKLAGVETGANKYIHPTTHPASMITESSTKRFVTDAKITEWDGKETPSGAKEKADTAERNAKDASLARTGGTITGDLSVTGKVSLSNGNEMTAGEVVFESQSGVGLKVKNANGEVSITPLNGSGTHFYTDRAYFFFNKTISLINNTLTSYQGDLQLQNRNTTKLTLKTNEAEFVDPVTAPSFAQTNGQTMETTEGSQAKVNTHANDSVKHITAAERIAWNNKSNLALGETSATAYRGDRGKVAYDHSQIVHAPSNAQKNSDIRKEEIEAKLTGNIGSHSHSQYVTQEQLGNSGYGDMMKSVYDTNNDGIVDKAALANSTPWTGVTGKPATFPPSSHTHDHIIGDDTREENPQPSEYLSGGTRHKGKTSFQAEFKRIGLIGLSGLLKGTYCFIETYTPWSDKSGGYPIQIAYGDGGLAFRIGVSETDWSPWESILTNKKKLTWNDLKGV